MTEETVGSRRTWWLAGLGLVAAWVLILAVFGPRPPREGDLLPPRLEPVSPPQRAEYRWKLLDLNDEPSEFARFKGRTVFLNLWATWCGPCVMELPSIVNLADNGRLKGVEFVCVSTDASSADVRKFLEGKNWNLTVLRATDLPEVFMTDGIPATFIIDRDGRIVAREVGAQQWDDPSVVDYLERLNAKASNLAPGFAPSASMPLKP